MRTVEDENPALLLSRSGFQEQSLVARGNSILDPAEQKLCGFAWGVFWTHRRLEGLTHSTQNGWPSGTALGAGPRSLVCWARRYKSLSHK
jgi:hypothetical protein